MFSLLCEVCTIGLPALLKLSKSVAVICRMREWRQWQNFEPQGKLYGWLFWYRELAEDGT